MFALLLVAVGTPDPPPIVADPPPIVAVTPEPAAIPGYRPVRFDGSVWLYEREVSQQAAPFAGYSFTPATSAPPAGFLSTGYRASTQTVRTITLAPATARPGGTNCPPSG